MLILKKIIKLLICNPLRLLSYLLIKTLPNNLIKKNFFYSKFLNKKIFLISFDCDTQKDIDVLEILLSKLNSISLKIVLAIPAELIAKNLDLIINLKKKYEIEFLNHGYYLHTKFNNKNYVYESIFSYEKKDFEFIKKDIILAHNFFKDHLNIKLSGFRAPHFGEINFDKKKKIFRYLKYLNYKFSTSSIYDLAYFNGPIFKSEGMTEISVTGCADNQVSILDSWSYLEKKDDKLSLSPKYLNELKKLNDILNDDNFNFINIYADPSHVFENDDFFMELKKFAKFNLLNFRDICLS